MPKVKIKKVPPAENGLSIENDSYKALSPTTLMLNGKSHSEGGTDISYNGSQVEAEKGEPISINNKGDLVVFGNMNIPGSKTKFKSAVKNIGEQEGKAVKQSVKANDLVAENDPYNKYESLGFNSGLVLQDAANQKLRTAHTQKEILGNLQQMILDGSTAMGIKPEDFESFVTKGKAKNGKTIKAQNGGFLNWISPQPIPSIIPAAQPQIQVTTPELPQPTYDPNNPQTYTQISVANAAIRNGVDPNLMQRLSFQESGFRPGVAGPQTKYGKAYGHVQFLIPNKGKGEHTKYGLTDSQIKSKKPEDIDAVSDAGAKHLKSLLDKYNGDTGLALIEYNGGEGAIKDVQKGVGKKNITSEEAFAYWDAQNEKNPSSNPNLYRNQTNNYGKNILFKSDEEFYDRNGYQGTGTNFRQTFYNGMEGTVRRPSFGPVPVNTSNDFSTQTRTSQDNFQYIPGYEQQLNNTQASILNDQLINAQRNYQPEVTPIPNRQMSSLADRNRLNPLDFLPEVAAILDRPNYVQGQQFSPYLQQPYSVSFQDQLNANQSTFNALSRNFANNPEALATLAGQQYQANQQVLGNEFRTNQQLYNTITNQNLNTMNQARLTNIELNDKQYMLQEQARANTEANRNAALQSISAKYAQNRAENNRIRMAENLFNYRPDQNLELQYQGPAYNFQQPITPTNTPQSTTLDTQMYKAQQQQAKAEQERLRTERLKERNRFWNINNLFGSGK